MSARDGNNMLLSERAASGIQRSLNFFNCFFIRLVAACRKRESMPPISDPLLLDPAVVLAEKIRTKQVSSVNVVSAFFKRIKETNSTFNFLVDDRFNDALEEAAAADELIASGRMSEEELAREKPLLGVPFSNKDSNAVKGMLQTAGLYWRRNFIADEDCDAVRLMRQAGAIPICLTNVPEMLLWWETNNTIYGRTKNVYDSRRIAGGSSGGESTVLALAGSPMGLGSDIGGSIRLPAHMNGIFGHKPTAKVVSLGGLYPPLAHDAYYWFATIGPLARYARDLRVMMKVLAGDKAASLNLDAPVDLSKLRFFYQENDGGGIFVAPVEGQIQDALLRVIGHLKSHIKANVEKIQLHRLKRSGEIWVANMSQDVPFDLPKALSVDQPRLNPHLELLKWCFGLSKHTFVALSACVVQSKSPQYGSPVHTKLIEKGEKLREEFQQLLGDDGVFIYPTFPTVAPYHSEPILQSSNFVYTAIFNILGFPATAVPLGLSEEGLPLGVQVVANLNQDRLCLAVAEELERAFGGWVPPKLIEQK